MAQVPVDSKDVMSFLISLQKKLADTTEKVHQSGGKITLTVPEPPALNVGVRPVDGGCPKNFITDETIAGHMMHAVFDAVSGKSPGSPGAAAKTGKRK